MNTRYLAHLALLPFLIQSAYAASDNVFTLGEVKVSANAQGTETIGSTSIDSDEMREQNRSDVGTALNLASGVYLTKGGARNEQMASVRGFDLRQVPIYMDGIPIYVPYDGYVDLARFSTYDLSRIEVSKGFSSSLYGANTLGGAINLVSRRPTKDFEGEIGGGFNFAEKGGMAGQNLYTNVGTNKGTWYMQAGLAYSNQDFVPMSGDFRPISPFREDGGKRNWSDQNDGRVNLKFGITPNATDEYAFNYIHQKGTKNTPPYTGNQVAAGQANRYWDWPYWEKESFYFLSKTTFGAHTLRVRAFHDRFMNSLILYNNAARTTTSGAQSYYNDFTNGFSVQDDIELSTANTLRVSYTYKQDTHRENATNTTKQYFQDLTQTFALEDTHRVNERLTLVGGISYEERQGQRADNLVGSTITSFKLADNSAINGQLAAYYKLNTTDAIRASYAKKSRFPTIKDRYSTGMGINLRNESLEKETADHYEIGYQTKVNQNLMLNGSLFYSEISNMIQSNRVNATQNQLQNIGRVDVTGIELGATGSIGKVDFGGNYTYLDRNNRVNNLFLTDTPAHKLFAQVTWNIDSKWKLNGSVETSSRRTSASTVSTITNTPQHAPGFAVVHTKTSYKFSNGLLLEAGVRNLFDKNYMYAEGYPEAGRTFFTQFNMPL